MCLAGSCPGWCDYLHALNLVSLVRVLGSCGSCWLVWLPACLEPRVLAGSCLAGSCPWFVLVGSGYLHTLNLVSLVRVSLLVRILVGSGYLHALNLVSLLVRTLLVRVPGSCWLEVVTCIP